DRRRVGAGGEGPHLTAKAPSRQESRSTGGGGADSVPAMNASKWIRQIHRWLAIAFTVTVVVTFVALAQEEPIVWVSYVPLLPLFLLLFTGLYLFVLPYATRW